MTTAFVATSVIGEPCNYAPASALKHVVPDASLLAILGLNVRHDLEIEQATRGVSSLSGNVCLTYSGDLLIGYKVVCQFEFYPLRQRVLVSEEFSAQLAEIARGCGFIQLCFQRWSFGILVIAAQKHDMGTGIIATTSTLYYSGDTLQKRPR
jgi:hypothetical protein